MAERLRKRYAGEIDLLFQKRGAFTVVEVKKSRTHNSARQALGALQIDRIAATMMAHLAEQSLPMDSAFQIDFATVDDMGTIKVIENITL